MLNFLERSFWLSVLLLAGLAVLLAGTLARLGGGLPPLRPLQPQTGAPPRFFSADRAEDWFAAPLLARLAIPTNTVNPFYTLYFQPPPPPPPPPTKKVELLYQGCYITSSTQKLAYVKLGDAMMILTNGAKVVADHAIKDIAIRTLTLTNAAGQTNLLEFNVKRALDVPAS
jgi:hypothetical protein